jgi:hypothetical protein
MAPLAIAVAVAGRRLIALVWTALGALAVVAAFALAGFWWPDGYALVKVRYYHGIAALRPYWYWVWANLAALALSAGPAAFVAARRGVTTVRPGETGRCWRNPAVLLGFGALTAILVADLSGLSKAEVERIWLPFAVWLLPFTALLPRPARPVWLGVQAVTALAVNHLLITVW